MLDYQAVRVRLMSESLTLFDIPPSVSPLPVRIRLSRAKGWRKPKDAVVVSRPSFWGNPFIIGTPENGGNITPAMAVAEFRKGIIEGRLQIKISNLFELRGRDLACWCALDQPCHADVLLELANRKPKP